MEEPEVTESRDGKIALKYTLKPNELLSVKTLSKSILAMGGLLENISKNLGVKSDIFVSDLACFVENGCATYVVEVWPIPKGTVISNVGYEENAPNKYKA